MTALDHNRAKSALAAKAGVSVAAVSHMSIWGNHSSTMYPDYENALIDGRPAPEVIGGHPFCQLWPASMKRRLKFLT